MANACGSARGPRAERRAPTCCGQEPPSARAPAKRFEHTFDELGLDFGVALVVLAVVLELERVVLGQQRRVAGEGVTERAKARVVCSGTRCGRAGARCSAEPATASWTPTAGSAACGSVKLAKVGVQFSGWSIAYRPSRPATAAAKSSASTRTSRSRSPL